MRQDGLVIEREVEVVFSRNKHELQGMLKHISGASKDAIDLLIVTMKSDDTPLKIKIDIARTIIELQAKICDQINKDTLTRQIADAKMGGIKTLNGRGGDSVPILDFSTIKEI